MNWIMLELLLWPNLLQHHLRVIRMLSSSSMQADCDSGLGGVLLNTL